MPFLKSLPKPILVFLVLSLGILCLFVFNRPHNLCDTQIEALQVNQKGYLFPLPVPGTSTKRPPLYEKALATCKLGQGSPGACYEYFKILERLTVDLEGLKPECGENLGEVKEVRRALSEGIGIMVELAWGESPPEKDRVIGWLEAPDLSLYCKLKNDWLKFFGNESFEKLKDSIFVRLPAREYKVDAQGTRFCTNCENPPKATDVLGGKEEVFGRSLFSISCRQYR